MSGKFYSSVFLLGPICNKDIAVYQEQTRNIILLELMQAFGDVGPTQLIYLKLFYLYLPANIIQTCS